MWKTKMLNKECFSNVKKTWDRQCRLNISKQMCTSVSSKQPNNKEWFLYLNMRNRVCRLNIREFCKRRPKCELVHDYYPGCPRRTIPTLMNPVVVGSKVYMWGGISNPNVYLSNPNVYSFDPARSPPFRLCEGLISRLVPPKIDFPFIIVFSLEEKIYVLEEDLSHFRVFDTVHQSWKDLPHPHYLPNTNPRVCDYCVCSHILYISTGPDISYIFDTLEEKWEDAKTIHNGVIERFLAFTEFEGFLIGVTSYMNKVVAYKLDSNGIPNPESYQVLREISSTGEMAFLGKCDGGRLWLVNCIMDDSYNRMCNATQVIVFQASISTKLDGNQALSVEIEARKFLDFEPSNYCSSAFTMCHDLGQARSALRKKKKALMLSKKN